MLRIPILILALGCGGLLNVAPVTPALAAEAVAGDAHGEGGAKPSVFPGTIAQSIAAIIVFLLLLVVLHKMAWGPILKGLQAREEKIRADLDDAERAAAEAKAAAEKHRQQLAEAQVEGGRIIDQSRSDAERVARQLREEAETQIAQLRERATHDIAAAKEQAIQDLYQQVATLSTVVASRILQREVKVEDQQQLIESSLDELARRN